MTTLKRIEVHYAICVPMTVEVDETGTTTAIPTTGTPTIDYEMDLGPDGQAVWDEPDEEWRFPHYGEWETGAHIIDTALRSLTDSETLDAIHAVLDGQDCGSDTVLDEITDAVEQALGFALNPHVQYHNGYQQAVSQIAEILRRTGRVAR